MEQGDLIRTAGLALIVILPLIGVALLDLAFPRMRRMEGQPGGRRRQPAPSDGRRRRAAARVGRRAVVAGLGVLLAVGVSRKLMQQRAEPSQTGLARITPLVEAPTTVAEEDVPVPPAGWVLLTHEGAYLTSNGRYLMAMAH